MTTAQRNELSQEITVFLATFAAEVHELRRSLSSLECPHGSDAMKHYSEVIVILLEVRFTIDTLPVVSNILRSRTYFTITLSTY